MRKNRYAVILKLSMRYRQRFPSGELAPEAARLRAEARLLLGRKATLLDELDRSLLGETASDEWVVLRGELRAAAGRWQAALADFDAGQLRPALARWRSCLLTPSVAKLPSADNHRFGQPRAGTL